MRTLGKRVTVNNGSRVQIPVPPPYLVLTPINIESLSVYNKDKLIL